MRKAAWQYGQCATSQVGGTPRRLRLEGTPVAGRRPFLIMPGSRVRVPPLLFPKARESKGLSAFSFSGASVAVPTTGDDRRRPGAARDRATVVRDRTVDGAGRVGRIRAPHVLAGIALRSASCAARSTTVGGSSIRADCVVRRRAPRDRPASAGPSLLRRLTA